MGLVSVVEAAGLSGLEPDTIRALIGDGVLQAVTVPLDCGTAYLVDPEQLRLAARPTRAGSSSLVNALAGLQGAIARRRIAAEARLEAAEEEGEPPPGPSGRSQRRVSGLREADLAALAARVDRLLGA